MASNIGFFDRHAGIVCVRERDTGNYDSDKLEETVADLIACCEGSTLFDKGAQRTTHCDTEAAAVVPKGEGLNTLEPLIITSSQLRVIFVHSRALRVHVI